MAATDTQSLPAHRPGPFGPAWALLPRGQKLLRLAADTPAKDALERMEQDGFSQAPVVDLHADGGRVIGVFSHRSFARGPLDYQHARKLDPLQQPVSELMDADQPVFARARELIVADLSDVNDIRNVVFHFRRPITVRDTDRLRRFRDKLRRGQRLRRERSPASA